MAAPSYVDDLTIISLCESTSGFSALGGGASGLGAGPDFAMEGNNAVDKQVSNAEKGQIYDYGSAIIMGADDHAFVWAFIATPGLMDTLENRGVAVVIGTTTNAYVAYHVYGSNVLKRGVSGQCYPIRYVTTASTGLRTPTGSPGANPRFFGATANVTGSVKGVNFAVDGMRYGTGYTITQGDSGTPATWLGLAQDDDASSNGIVQGLGTAQTLQGKTRWGSSATAVYSRDSNRLVTITDTPHSLADFTEIFFENTGSDIEWSNISFVAEGTNNRGRVEFVDATPVKLRGCSWDGLEDFVLDSSADWDETTFRRCGLVTQSGASLSNCIFGNARGPVAVLADDVSKLDGSVFTSDGTGHAIEDTTSGAKTIDNQKFVGYASTNGSTGNEAYYNNSGGHVDLTVLNGTSPSVRNGSGATTTIILPSQTLTITGIPTGAEWRLYEEDPAAGKFGGTELAGEETKTGTTKTYDYTWTSDVNVVLQVMADGYVEYTNYTVLGNSNQSISVILTKETNT